MTRKTKSDIIKDVAKQENLPVTVTEKVVNAFVDAIHSELNEGNEIAVFGLGTFSTKFKPAHNGTDPRNGELMEIKATTVPKFTFSKPVKDSVKNQYKV